MFRNTMLSLVALVAFSTMSFAAGTFQYQTVIMDGVSTPRFVITENASMTDHLGWSAYVQVDHKWAEAYAGPSISPTSWMQLSVQAGTESATKVMRKAGFVWLGHGNLSALALVEGGGSARFVVVETKYTAKYFSAGYFHDNFFGHGAKFTVPLTKKYAAWVIVQQRETRITLLANI